MLTWWHVNVRSAILELLANFWAHRIKRDAHGPDILRPVMIFFGEPWCRVSPYWSQRVETSIESSKFRILLEGRGWNMKLSSAKHSLRMRSHQRLIRRIRSESRHVSMRPEPKPSQHSNACESELKWKVKAVKKTARELRSEGRRCANAIQLFLGGVEWELEKAT